MGAPALQARAHDDKTIIISARIVRGRRVLRLAQLVVPVHSYAHLTRNKRRYALRYALLACTL